MKINFTNIIGPIKPLHGVCNSPVAYGDEIPSFKEAGIPYVTCTTQAAHTAASASSMSPTSSATSTPMKTIPHPTISPSRTPI